MGRKSFSRRGLGRGKPVEVPHANSGTIGERAGKQRPITLGSPLAEDLHQDRPPVPCLKTRRRVELQGRAVVGIHRQDQPQPARQVGLPLGVANDFDPPAAAPRPGRTPM